MVVGAVTHRLKVMVRPEPRYEVRLMFGTHNISRINYLSAEEVDSLLHGAKGSKFGLRDYAMMLLAYRHGLRVSELISALLVHVDFRGKQFWVERKRNGLSSYQVLSDDELRALTAYLATRDDSLPWLFLSMQRTRMTRQNFSYLIGQSSERAGMGKLHPHVLRDSFAHVNVTNGTDPRVIDELLGRRLLRIENFEKPVGPRRGSIRSR